ncbi:hypothetical protein [Ruegeria sp. ANG-S4]|uniref:hypothetical protein n=1 Tax=Ruegeria sp. ANG-S4 TaxID=1577904 RepID=UPI0006898244|nr:hypothetical protein [Ruegeria sp. ANG-S4]
MKRPLIVTLVSLHASVATGAPDYMDDRSSAEDVVQSLYNAINRSEYLRAWSYFQSGAAPNYADFKSGYNDTRSVELRLGQAVSEGAAGSIETRIPVVIRSHLTDGTHAVFEGCYTLVQVDPSVQDAPPFRPIQISAGHLKKSSSSFEAAAPSCD